jgi:N-acetylmuramic acid 6-phosphate etherase
MEDRGYLLTEQANPASWALDQLSPLGMVELFICEDSKVIPAVAEQKQQIAQAITIVSQALGAGGRLFYVGAGTSGRLGVLDAAECPPTFCTPPDLIQGIIAGGLSAMVRSAEALEDSASEGAQAMQQAGVTHRDVVLGISAGGTTPFVHGALQEAKRRGATTIFLTCVPAEQVATDYHLEIRPLVGAEILAGSTRLKAGTATKLVLNMISTGAMVRLGKVYGNRMVDVAVTNQKLADRAIRILCDLTGCDRPTAAEYLKQTGNNTKLALLMLITGTPTTQVGKARRLLAQHNGNIRSALQEYR